MPQSELMEALNQTATVDRLMDDVHRAMLAHENEAVEEIRREYTFRMRKVVSDLTALNAEFMAGNEPTYSQWKQLKLDIQSAKLISENMSTYRQDLIDRIERDIRDTYVNSYNTATWAIDQTTPFNYDPAYNLPQGNLIDLLFQEPWNGQRFSDTVHAMTDKWAIQIQDQLNDSIMKGDSVPEMARKIRDYVGVPADEKLISRPRASAQLYRATLIARTEMIRAGRMAQDQVYADNADILMDKEWSAKPGLFGVCDECRDKNGKTPSQILAMGYSLEEHPNGRCAWIPVLKPYQDVLAPYIAKLKAMPGKIDSRAMLEPNELGNWKPVSIEPYQEWEIKYLNDSERGL